MKLDPIYLVAPSPEPERPPGVSRRTLLAGVVGALGIGVAAGVGLRSWMGVSGSDGAPTNELSEGMRWALQVQEGPLEDLVQNRETLLFVFSEENDPRLVPGVLRLCEAVLNGDPAVEGVQVSLARLLADIVERTPSAVSLRGVVPRLRRIR